MAWQQKFVKFCKVMTAIKINERVEKHSDLSVFVFDATRLVTQQDLDFSNKNELFMQEVGMKCMTQCKRSDAFSFL